MSDIKSKVSQIKDMQGRLDKELKRIQEECSHDNKQGSYKSDTGNWSPDENTYWIRAECIDCSKVWNIDASKNKEEYQNFNGILV